MRIIISPAKQMICDTETLSADALPVFLDKTKEILSFMQSLSYEEAKKLWGCNDKLAEQNFERFRDMELYKGLTPAILAYDGIAFKYMAPSVFEFGEFDYVQTHLRILSGFYGVLKPLDGVAPYRLEMQAKAKVSGTRNLYDFWGPMLYQEVPDEDRIIINLASKEYSKCIEKYLTPEDTCITCIFGEMEKGKLVQKGVYAKMARGEMVRFMAEKNICEPQGIKAFDRLGFSFEEGLSTPDSFVFLRDPKKA